MNWLVRFDVIVLALFLAYTFSVVTRITHRIYVGQRALGIDAASRKKLAAELNIEVDNLKSIASTAPYLGLAGTCFGIMDAFRGVDMERHAALAMITSIVAASLVTTAAGIIVAVPATCSYNYLRTRLDFLEYEVPARRLPLRQRFSELPAFGLIAAPGLTILVAAFTTFASFHAPVGFAIELASARCESASPARLIVLHIANGGKLFLNAEQQEWSTLETRLSELYSTRVPHTLCLSADEHVPFQTLADAIDIIRSTPSAGEIELSEHRAVDNAKSDESSLR